LSCHRLFELLVVTLPDYKPDEKTNLAPSMIFVLPIAIDEFTITEFN